MEVLLKKSIEIVLLITIFLFPIFFLTTTQEFYYTNKAFFLFGSILLLLSLLAVRLIIVKKITIKKTPFDLILALIIATSGLSLVISSPNKIASLMSVPTGFATILALIFFSFILTQVSSTKSISQYIKALWFSAIIASFVTIIFFFNPLANTTLPAVLSFLKSPLFTPVGSPLDLLLFLGFFVVYALSAFIASGGRFELPKSGGNKVIELSVQKEATKNKPLKFYEIAGLVLAVIAMIMTAYLLFGPKSAGANFKLPPFSLSWNAAVETLKTPQTAIFGVGADNFVTMFTRVKTVGYNMTDLWQLNFNRASSLLLQVWIETGLLGLASFIILMATSVKIILSARLKKNVQIRTITPGFFYLLAILIFLPPSLPILFLFFSLVAFASLEETEKEYEFTNKLEKYPAVAILISLVSFMVIAGLGYSAFRAYSGEFYFKKGLDGFTINSGETVYPNIVKSIQANPFIEGYHVAFSQVNLLIANNIATKKTITDQDRQTIAQIIQQAIAQAKMAVQLNPQKSANWENLAIIYRNIINVAQGADTWTIGSYQRAIQADPTNPILRIGLGGVYYSMQSFDEAVILFQQAVQLKPDWANAHYNLAWSFFQNKKYMEAAVQMQNVLALVEKGSPDYQKALGDFESFKEKLPKGQPEGESALQPSDDQEPLTLPTPPEAVITPRIELPESAAPEEATPEVIAQ